MVILKKIVIMTEYGKSNCSGIVKFENFAGRTSCFVRILGVKVGGVLCIKCGEDIVYCGDLFEGEKRFNALYDLNKPIQIAALYEGSVVCLGSNRGRFIPTAIVGDIHKYFAMRSGAVEQVFTQPSETATLFPSETAEIAAAAENTENTEVIATAAETAQPVATDNADETAQAMQAVEAVEAVETPEYTEEVVAPIENENAQNTSASEEREEVFTQATTPTVKAATTAKKTVKPKQDKAVEPFYKKIETSMQELFDKHESDEELTLLIPDSKWVRVPTEDDGYYVVGVIYSEEIPNVICYGVPDKDSATPPQSDESCRQWLELEKGGRGYWMMYQSAANGETLTSAFGE